MVREAEARGDAVKSYCIPSMVEIAAMPSNGLTLVSTFSGCGGTCLGFRMAGYSVLWANDSDAHAQSAYRANHPDSPLDPRDIREVTAPDILGVTGLAPGDLDVFEGSPPCTVFSATGSRSAKWGGVARHAGVSDVRIEELFFEWIRLLDGLQPRAFVAENVPGLRRGVARGYFNEILAGMQAAGYRVRWCEADAQWCGVPQRRKRILFLGVRSDLRVAPRLPKPDSRRYGVREALPWVGHVEGYNRGYFDQSPDLPMPTIVSHRGQKLNVCVDGRMRHLTIDELKRLSSFPNDFVLTGGPDQQRAQLGNAVPPLMAKVVAMAIHETLREARS